MSFSPFVLSLPNSRAFELNCCHINVLEAFDKYTDQEAKHFYNDKHEASRGKSKAYRQLAQHQLKLEMLMPADPATLLIVHNIYFHHEFFSYSTSPSTSQKRLQRSMIGHTTSDPTTPSTSTYSRSLYAIIAVLMTYNS